MQNDPNGSPLESCVDAQIGRLHNDIRSQYDQKRVCVPALLTRTVHCTPPNEHLLRGIL